MLNHAMPDFYYYYLFVCTWTALTTPIYEYPICRNVTGTLLTTSGDDPSICVWKKDFSGEWIIAVQVKGDFMVEDGVLLT